MAHPIERLRWAARNEGDGPRLAGLQAARALGGFNGDPAGLVTACRRLVQRQPAMGPVWWVTARMLTTPDTLATTRMPAIRPICSCARSGSRCC